MFTVMAQFSQNSFEVPHIEWIDYFVNGYKTLPWYQYHILVPLSVHHIFFISDSVFGNGMPLSLSQHNVVCSYISQEDWLLNKEFLAHAWWNSYFLNCNGCHRNTNHSRVYSRYPPLPKSCFQHCDINIDGHRISELYFCCSFFTLCFIGSATHSPLSSYISNWVWERSWRSPPNCGGFNCFSSSFP